MSTENQESQKYLVDEIRYRPQENELVIQVEGGLTFVLTQTPGGLFAQLLLNQAASQRAAILRDDVVSAADSLLKEPSPQLVANPSPATTPAVSSTDSQPAAPSVEAAPTAEIEAAEEKWGEGEEREFTGRLKSKPRNGNTDSNGLPTAWARLAAHQDGKPEALMLSASFHKHTRGVALGLNLNDQITARGYFHKTEDPKRMHSLRVFMFINHPNKPPRDTPEQP